MVTFKNGQMIVIDGEEENRLLCKMFNCSPETEKELPTVNHPIKDGARRATAQEVEELEQKYKIFRRELN